MTPGIQQPPWQTPDMAILGSGRSSAPTFPIDVLGDFWSPWAKAQAEGRSSPVDYVAAGLLAAASTLIGNARRAAVHEKWIEPTHAWFAIIGDPSAGKTQALKATLEILRAFDSEQLAERKRLRQAHDRSVLDAKIAHKAWKKAAERAMKGGFDAPAMPEEADVPAFDEVPRFAIIDATVEKVARVLATSPKGILLERDELAGWLGSFDRYGGGGDRAFWLEAYNGGWYTIDRVGEPDTVVIDRLAVGVIGGFQPDRLQLVVSGGDDGLAARFLFFWPDPPRGFKIRPVQTDDRRATVALRRLRDLELAVDEAGRLRPKPVPLSSNAIPILEAFGGRMRAEAAAATGPLAGVYGKAAGSVLRLATILTYLCWAVRTGEPEPRIIGQDAIEAAITLMDDYFLVQAQRVFGEASIPEAERHAKLLARAILDRGCRVFNARGMGRTLAGPLREARNMEIASTVLVEAGWIRPKAHLGTRRKDFEVNPQLFAFFS